MNIETDNIIVNLNLTDKFKKKYIWKHLHKMKPFNCVKTNDSF